MSSRSFLFQALHLNTEDINLVHGLFIPSKQEAGLTSIGEIGGIFSQINGIVKVENIKRIWVKLLTYFLKLRPYSMGEKGRRG